MEKDWRLTNQENYLKNQVLVFKNYGEKTAASDHDHCEFCWEKFGVSGGDLRGGYCTEDGYRWICPTCYNDFKALFKWK